ncbi:hypothetical protein Pelo_10034 [Pelomyxa schiedti]|nr:hypothetical protein Pelo_10034 [Pelomyxa schiedti]
MYYVNPDGSPVVGQPPPGTVFVQMDPSAVGGAPTGAPIIMSAGPTVIPMTVMADPSATAVPVSVISAVGSTGVAAAAAETGTGAAPPTEGSIVPREFRAACDAIYDTLPKTRDVVGRVVVCGEWSRYGEPENVVQGVYDIIEQSEAGATRDGFALGCYLLASRKPGVAMSAPKMCSSDQFIQSGFKASRRVDNLLTSGSRRTHYNVLAMCLAANVFFGIISAIYWVLAPCSIVTMALSIYLYCLYHYFPFLMRNRIHFAKCIIAFGVLGCIFAMGGFIMMACLGDENITHYADEDWAFLWGCTWVAWYAFQFPYVIMGTVGFALMLRELNRLDRNTLIMLPSIEVVTQAGNTLALFVTGWVFCVLGSLLLIGLSIASMCSMDVRIVSAITMWAVVSPFGTVATGLLAEVVRRRYRTLVSTLGLIVSLLVLLSGFYAGIPIFIFGVYWD